MQVGFYPAQTGFADKEPTMFKPTRLSFTLAALLASAVVQADIEVPLGSTQRVTQLFALPNNCNVI